MYPQFEPLLGICPTLQGTGFMIPVTPKQGVTQCGPIYYPTEEELQIFRRQVKLMMERAELIEARETFIQRFHEHVFSQLHLKGSPSNEDEGEGDDTKPRT